MATSTITNHLSTTHYPATYNASSYVDMGYNESTKYMAREFPPPTETGINWNSCKITSIVVKNLKMSNTSTTSKYYTGGFTETITAGRANVIYNFSLRQSIAASANTVYPTISVNSSDYPDLLNYIAEEWANGRSVFFPDMGK